MSTVIADRFRLAADAAGDGTYGGRRPLGSAQTDVKGILLPLGSPGRSLQVTGSTWSERAKSELVDALVQNGLDPDEAAALTNRDLGGGARVRPLHLARLIRHRLGISQN